jgi:hypothetical protein
MQNGLRFLHPGWITMVVFLALAVSMPVWYVYSEPERTNYLIGEEQVWITKSKHYPSTLQEYLFHTDGDFDILLGIVGRNYLYNQIGLGLLLVYYIVGAGANLAAGKIRGRRPDRSGSG